MPPLKDVTTMITAARSRQIRFTMIIQNFAQLNKVYGKEDAETIKGNCGNIIYLISTELAALEEISKMCGEVKSKKDDKTASTPLVTVSDLQRMKQFETIILRMRKQPFKTKMTPDFKIDWGQKYPHRNKMPVHTFDIKEFVKSEKKKKLLEMMNASDEEGGLNKTPFGMPVQMGENKQSPPPRAFNPFEQQKASPKSGDKKEFDNGFDVDELVKKIDAKIAELEEEERKNKEKEEKAKSEEKLEVIGDKESEDIHKDKVIVQNLDLDDDDDDDDFFDDFFDN